jgi:ribosomal protein L40E
MEFFHRLLARLRSLFNGRSTQLPLPSMPQRSEAPLAVTYFAPIYREVTRDSVRVFSLCGCCGARLQASATLCEECAQKQSRPARPF